MFVKLDGYFDEKDSKKSLILNTDSIISIEWGATRLTGENIYTIYMSSGEGFEIGDKEYNELCDILTKRL